MKPIQKRLTLGFPIFLVLSLACNLLSPRAPTTAPEPWGEQSTPTQSEESSSEGEVTTISQRIEAATGGTVELTSPRGDRIRLFIPPFALSESVEISLTALASPPANPIATNVFAGVILEPNNLPLRLPARLTVTPASSPSGSNPLLLHLRQPDFALPLSETSWDGTSLTGRLLHFSTFLGGSPTAEEAQTQAQQAADLGETTPRGSQERSDGTQALGEWSEALDNMGLPDDAQNAMDEARRRLEEDINCLFDLNCTVVPLDPCGDYLQKLMQYHSQATLLGFDPESKMMTDLYTELERVLNDCTNRYTLEYDHQLKVNQMGFEQEFHVTGKVIFTAPIYGVFALGEPLKFQGQGPVDVVISGQVETGDEICTISGNAQNQVVIGGEMTVDEFGAPQMSLKLTESWYTEGQMTFTCPDGRSQSVPLPGRENHEIPLVLPYQDGAEYSAPNLGGMEGTYRWILHIIHSW